MKTKFTGTLNLEQLNSGSAPEATRRREPRTQTRRALPAPVQSSKFKVQSSKFFALLAVLTAFCLLPSAFAQSGAPVRVNELAEGVGTPRILTISSTPTLLFPTNPATLSGKSLLRTVQNLGTNAFYYILRGTNHLSEPPGWSNQVSFTLLTNITSTNLHGIVAGGVAANDGLGSIVNLSRWRFGVYAVCPSGSTTISVVELTQ